ncbi:MAG TPA: class I SAM-dependent DNA methyltransferase [Desulfuromonadales bacterium]|nr:class I SAM-dependent DNA methyltransferase [Desulfuromonadales bacterium]
MSNVQAADTMATAFIKRWEPSGGKELANYQSFLIELSALLNVDPPDPTTADDKNNSYVFERSVPNANVDDSGGVCRIDLYKRRCFILETKQGVHRQVSTDPFMKTAKPTRKGHAVRGTGGWDLAMIKAREQAEGYARGLPVDEGRPPFLVVVDVGHCIELYSEFSCTGGIYRPFPDSSSYRISLKELEKPEIRERLRLVWTEPLTLDPSRHSAKVTRELAIKLADLAKSLEFSGHKSNDVGEFLMRCLFTFFAEDIGLLPDGSFTGLLVGLRGNTEIFPDTLKDVWEAMNAGKTSIALKKKLLHFNGGLLENAKALAVNDAQLELLIEAGKADWGHVEPAIFGTLLERALNPTERHYLGAHYTPRDYVERLVLPAVIEPLTTEWEKVKAKVIAHLKKDQTEAAKKLLKSFHHKLCTIRILDPACGSGNFLYVTFEHLKRLEGEVLTLLDDLGEHAMLELESVTVNPNQLLGIEVNPRAAVITDMVLWIGYLQWHFRTRGNVTPPIPVIKKFHNVECRDAVLTWDKTEPLLDEKGEAVTRWDGVTFKKHPVTGENVPDETARIPFLRYINPGPASWPKADYVVGNPPFIGNKRMRLALGDGYVEAVRKAWADVPDSADFVMYWWQQAAELTRRGKLQGFGFITTNSLTQEFNRRVLQQHLVASPALSLAFAIPDHPWVDSADGAAVRIAMTVGKSAKEGEKGTLVTVISEKEGTGEGLTVELDSKQGVLHADLTAGANAAGTVALKANDGLSNRGMIPHGEAFLVTQKEAEHFGLEAPLRPYRNGRDLTSRPRGILAIDTFGYTESDLQNKHPAVWQWLYERVKPDRDQNPRKSRRENWWLFGENQPRMRRSVQGLPRYIATVQTAKHRFFVFLESNILPDDKLIAIATDDAFVLGVLSSRLHIDWALITGGHLGVGNDPIYNKTKCFDAFPFPTASNEQIEKVRSIAESLDAHRKAQQALHPDLGITDMYNVLEKLRAGATLTEKERSTHDKGLVTLLKKYHDDLDTAVFAAYGWPETLTDEQILESLVALNLERVNEEKQGLIRWLRPVFQNPVKASEPVQVELELESEEITLPEKQQLPKEHTAQLQAVKAVLSALKATASVEEVAKCFIKASSAKVQKLLDDLAALGLAKKISDGAYRKVEAGQGT